MSTKVWIAQEEAGDDGKYHWKLLFGKALSSAIFYDVVWGATKEEGMVLRGPKPFVEASSRGFIKLFDIGTFLKEDGARVAAIVQTTPRPQYTVEDKDKNCQTWTLDVIDRLISEGFLPRSAKDNARRVPTDE